MSDFKVKLPIRTVQFHDLKIGGDKSFYFMKENGNVLKPFLAFEIPAFSALSHIATDYFKTDNIIKIVEKSQELDCDIFGIKFDISDLAEVPEAEKLLKEILPLIKKPIMIRGANNKAIDEILLPKLVEILDRKSIVAFADDITYKKIVPPVVKGGHILVIRTPIDINLAKEMNILSTDMGLDADKILIDTDMGGLGYGLEYGYSVMERIKLAAFEGDDMLNMPLIAFVGEESLRVKEAKSDAFSDSWGDFKLRSAMFEISTASAVISAGANVVVLQNPDSLEILRKVLNG
jgi:acetyl-CoA decarbonylase/synthase, CODH/ACS complex subunit delta